MRLIVIAPLLDQQLERIVLKKLSYLLFGCVAAFLGAYVALLLREDFKTLDGETHSWQGLKGKWVVVNYFAQWCIPCLKEIPELNEFARFARQQDNVELFAVNYDLMNPVESKAIVEKYSIEFDLMEEPPVRAPFSRPKALPATFIISPDGALVARLDGEQTNSALQKTIEQLQSQK